MLKKLNAQKDIPTMESIKMDHESALFAAMHTNGKEGENDDYVLSIFLANA